MSPAAPVSESAIVAGSFSPTRGVAGLGIVLHVRKANGKDGFVMGFSEAYSDVPNRDLLAFGVVRALELVRERGARQVKVRGLFPKPFRGPIAAPSVQPPGLLRRWSELATSFELARVQWISRRRTLTARQLARAALSVVAPWQRPELFPDGPIGPSVHKVRPARGDRDAWLDELIAEDELDGCSCELSDQEVPF